MKFVLVKDHPIVGTQIQKSAHLKEMAGYVRSPHCRVIHAPDMVFKATGESIQSLIIAVTTRQVALRSYEIVIPAPFGVECGIMAVLRVKGNGVIPVPAVHNSLLHVKGYLAGQLEW